MARPRTYKPSCLETEILLARHFNIRRYIIVPNVSWGLNLHECDLLIVTKSGYATEIEIKISLSDLKREAKKKHDHSNQKIKEFYFAIPEKLLPHINLIPEHAGIFVIKAVQQVKGSDVWYAYIEKHRPATRNKFCRPLDAKELQQLTRLGCMRIWGLKQSLLELRKNKSK